MLASEPIVRWLGHEMALAGGNAVVTDETVTSGFAGESPVLWVHPDVPFWQFTELDFELKSGRVCRLLSQIDDGTGPYGLLLFELEKIQEPANAEDGSIFRTRELSGLPTGLAKFDVLRQSASGAVIEVALAIGSDVVRLLAAEIHEQHDGSLHIHEEDESILLQVNGQRPT